jgi:hypothetical protein
MPDYGTPENPYIISAPGWEDLVRFRPKLIVENDPIVSKQDVAIYYSYKKKGQLSKAQQYLGVDKFFEMQTKDMRIEMLKASPTPEYVKSIAKVMTYIDDTEDLLSTALVLGRALLKKSPWLLARVGTKFIPGLGWALLAVDILEISTMLWKLLIPGMGGKKKGFDILSPSRWKKKGRLKAASKFMKGKFGVPAAIEALQASETLFGVGLQLGPIVGYATDSAFGLGQKAFGASVVEKPAPTGQLKSDIDRVMRGMSSSTMLMHIDVPGFQDVHMMALFAYALGLQVAHNFINDQKIIDRSNIAMAWNMPHEIPWDLYTRDMLLEYGIDPDVVDPWPLPGSPAEISVENYAGYLANSGERIIQDYMKRWPSGEEALFVSSTLREILYGNFNCDRPPEQWIEEDVEWQLSSEESLMLETIETGVRPPIEAEYITPVNTSLCTKMLLHPETGPAYYVAPGNLPYLEELELLAADYEVMQYTFNRTKIGSSYLKKLIVCHFGKTMPLQQIPTGDAF